ncbi:hypothetical protein C5167_004475 [Papaver somniferum]|uniref:Uncharacterized protein n=1 Tax=Papaver somniferum TaxID=3469 RepID=A0A4Y7JAX8_PAPSO|nr:hypothetical protein C5167_004475 [Papaver somniferum]
MPTTRSSTSYSQKIQRRDDVVDTGSTPCSLPSSQSSSTSSSQNGTVPSPFNLGTNNSTLSNEGRIHCPFKTFDSCFNGVGSNGYSKSGFYKHLHDRHLPNLECKNACRERISSSRIVYEAWERTLNQLQMWLCVPCMHIQAWKKSCASHVGGAIAGPLDGTSVEFLIYGITKPADTSDTIPAVVQYDDVVLNGVALNLDMLNLVYQKRFATLSVSPHLAGFFYQ